MEIGRFYEHRDLYDRCQSCRSCLDKGYLVTPFEKHRLPVPWQGSVGPGVKVLFLFARPSFTKFSPRLSDNPDASALRTTLDRQYESHAIGFKRRRSVDGSIRTYARRIASILLENPEGSIRDFDDYLFTSLVRCNGDRKQGLKKLELIVNDCLNLHGADLFERLPNLQWIVLVGASTHRLLSLPGAWTKFRTALHLRNGRQHPELPPPVYGVSEVVSLNEHLRLITVPHFSRATFRIEHYRRIFTCWMTRPPLEKSGGRGPLDGAPRAAIPN